jgi:uncharacterized protein YkwD
VRILLYAGIGTMSKKIKPLAGAFLACVWTVGLGGLLPLSNQSVWAGSSSRLSYASQPRRINYLRQTALDLVNQDRTRYRLSRLRTDALLTKAAQKHAEDMLRRNYFSHYSPEGSTPSARFAAVGGRQNAGENLLMLKDVSLARAEIGFDKLAYFERGWMGSPEHRQNMLDPRYGRFGFGLAVSGDRLYAVQLFTFP